jgi:hypothetical protein|tara:strand:- start:1690 stop:4710 length:3021 start_codon:yes stop_codon:yes gene_type:complete
MATIDFNQQIRPILSDKCFKCHGPDAKNQKSDFRLDTFEHATEEHDGVRGLVPGKLEESEIHWLIRSDDSDEVMPPPKAKLPLTEKEKGLLDQWIKEGGEYKNHWSFEPIPPTVKAPVGKHPKARNEIDYFIANRLDGTGLAPSAETNKETWLRRVTFDLTGLPPTIEELDGFLADTSPTAHEKVVDRLLETDAHAERLASEWLDVARYADTYGYQQDRNRHVWPWRDWVIRAFQKNLPFDQFVTEQIAGDLLPNATQDQILATCFNRLHSQKVEGGSVPEEFRIEYVSDRVHTFGTAFLGLSFECMRCHDNKYDPFEQEEYYSLSAFFNNIDEAGLYSWFTNSVPTPTLELGKLPSDAKVKSAEAELQRIAQSADTRKAFMAWDANRSQELAEIAPPLAHLDFDELKGGKLANLADPKKPASSSPNNKPTDGKLGKAIRLTGDDPVKFPNGVGDFNRHQPFSLALWIKPGQMLERGVVARRSQAWTDAGSRGYELLLEDGKLSFALIHFWPGNAIRIQSRKAVPLNEWTHVAATYDGSSQASGLNLYENGILIKPKVARDHLTREITGGGSPFLALGERMRDRGFKNGSMDELYLYDRKLSGSEVRTLAQLDSEPTKEDLFEIFLQSAYGPYLKQANQLKKERAAFGKARERIPEIMVMKEMPGNRATHLLNRGLYSDRKAIVTADTPAILPPFPEKLPRNRLGLAQWLTGPDHPLFARVSVNRYWQMVFGRGFVSTPEDFSSQGNPPTHPELLDWLARDFVNSGWDLRRMFKKMVLSATYRQKSEVSPKTKEVDPENLLLSRGPTYRMPSEMIRDSALAVSGLLNRKVGGAGVRPYDLKVSFKPINPDKAPNVYRRSVYTFWKRTAPAPLMMTLDSSRRSVCTVKRERTDSPSQTLVLLNGPQFVEAARATAHKLIEIHGKENENPLVSHAFRLLTSRRPDEKEIRILVQLLADQKTAFSDPAEAKKFLATGEYKAMTDDPTHLAAVTTLVSAIMNFDESISKR